MSRVPLHRGFFLALAVVLGAFSVYSVVAIGVRAADGSYIHFRVVAIVIGDLLVMALAVLAAWLALRSWRLAKSN
jgi:hypothetical protein